MQKIVLLDLGGVIVKEPADERLVSENQVELFDDTVSALKKLADAGFQAIIITNQAGIGEGLITVDDFERIHAEVLQQIALSSLNILKTYMCPHATDDNCVCRKPKPDMILKAAKELSIDLSNTFMIGDHETDIQAAKSAGAKGILVKTTVNHQDESEADFIAENLTEAVDYILQSATVSQ
jgi:D-glycero-D-manno-heptose 1,7-bisphosphate phosphatase